ncbi:LuxR C-terminal-related transcriptional regulator [Arthrobacter sulfonylureivorans]|uniref:LuxR C-terminal-related transcriptional regulator n=1 Tax=Arthrobacter sulfonylureivorans TaxID=2486855 RepID=UPI0039E33AA1
MSPFGAGDDSFVGRALFRQGLKSSLDSDLVNGAVLVADAGMGKSALVRHVLKDPADGTLAIWIQGSPVLSAVPFGAMAPHLSLGTSADALSALAVLRGFREFLEMIQTGAGVRPVVVVDDAQHLDTDSALLLAQLTAAEEVRLVVLTRSITELPNDLLALGKDGLLRRIDLAPLTAAEAHSLCASHLGGDVLPSASRYFHAAAGGNPLFMKLLIDRSRSVGHVVQRKGFWVLSGEPPQPGRLIGDLVQAQLSSRTISERMLLETIGLGEPVPLSALLDLGNPSAVDALENDGLITHEDSPMGLARLTQPLVAAVIRETVPMGRRMDLRNALTQVFNPEDEPAAHTLRWVEWALDCGSPVSSSALLRAAAEANQFFDPDFAIRTAAKITDPELAVEATVELARARMLRNELEDAEELLGGLIAAATSLEAAEAAAWMSARYVLAAKKPGSRVGKYAEEWRAAIERIAQLPDGETGAEQLKIARDSNQLLEYYALNGEGLYSRSLPGLTAMAQKDASTPVNRMLALALLGEALAYSGKIESGLRASAEAMHLMGTGGHTTAVHAGLVVRRHLELLILGGRWEQTEADLALYPFTEPRASTYFGGTVGLAQARVLCRQGRFDLALPQIGMSIEALHQHDMEQLLPLALGLGAYAAAVCGERELAERYSGEFEAGRATGHAPTLMLGRCYAVAARAALDENPAELMKLADQLAALGLVAVETQALELGLHLGCVDLLLRLADTPDQGEGTDRRILASIAKAHVDGDLEAMASAAAEATDAGYTLMAAACLDNALAYAQELPRHPQLAKVRRDIIAAREQLSEVPRPIPAQAAGALPQLTRRELAIAALVRRGASNREIANELSVSTRTVEGHLYRMFSKLGISRREDLPKLIGK